MKRDTVIYKKGINMATCNRIWATAKSGLSFEDMKKELPIADKENGVLGENNDIIKLTLLKNIYEQNVLAEIFYDASEGRYVCSDQYDKGLCEAFADKFLELYLNVDNIQAQDPTITTDHLMLVVGAQMTEYMINSSKETY